MTCVKGLRSPNIPADQAIPIIADAWAKHIRETADGGCGKQSWYHTEVDALSKARDAQENLAAGTFTQLTSPLCFICCAVLHAVGFDQVRAKADSTFHRAGLAGLRYWARMPGIG